jgi:hypothetical protein
MKPDLTKEELARLPKNIITRALGMKDVVKVDIRSEPILPGDTFLLCSDGLTGMVPVNQILEVVGLTTEPQEACELLIAEANDAGGTDNISAVLVRVEEEIPESDADIEAHAELAEDDVEEVAALDDEDAAAEEVDPDALFEDGPEAEDDAATRPFQIADAKVADAKVADAKVADARRRPPSVPPPGPFVNPFHSVPVSAPAPLAVVEEEPLAEGPASSPAPWGSADPFEGDEDDPATRPFQGATIDLVHRVPPDVARAESARRAAELAHLAARQAEDDASPELSAEPAMDDFSAAELAAVLAEGGEIDLDLRGPWPSRVVVRRCACCRHELFPGNRFCVECGARIESATV